MNGLGQVACIGLELELDVADIFDGGITFGGLTTGAVPFGHKSQLMVVLNESAVICG